MFSKSLFSALALTKHPLARFGNLQLFFCILEILLCFNGFFNFFQWNGGYFLVVLAYNSLAWCLIQQWLNPVYLSTVWPCQLISWCCQWWIFPRVPVWTWCPRACWQSARLWTRVAGSATLAGILYTTSGCSSCQQARVHGRVVKRNGFSKKGKQIVDLDKSLCGE